MKNPRCKCNLSCFEGVVCRKRNCQNEYTALIWAVFVSHITACQGHMSCPTGLTHKAPVVLRIPGFCGELKVGQCGWSIGGEWGRCERWGRVGGQRPRLSAFIGNASRANARRKVQEGSDPPWEWREGGQSERLPSLSLEWELVVPMTGWWQKKWGQMEKFRRYLG